MLIVDLGALSPFLARKDPKYEIFTLKGIYFHMEVELILFLDFLQIIALTMTNDLP